MPSKKLTICAKCHNLKLHAYIPLCVPDIKSQHLHCKHRTLIMQRTKNKKPPHDYRIYLSQTGESWPTRKGPKPNTVMPLTKTPKAIACTTHDAKGPGLGVCINKVDINPTCQ